MLYVNSITNAIYTILSSDSVLVNSGYTVTINQNMNIQPEQSPWVGVYCEGFDLEPRVLGSNQPWRASLELGVYVQIRDESGDPDAGFSALYRALAPVLTVVSSFYNLNGMVDQITAFNSTPITPKLASELAGAEFVERIGITAEVRA